MISTSILREMLKLQRTTLDKFCLASGARINWHKSYGLLVGMIALVMFNNND